VPSLSPSRLEVHRDDRLHSDKPSDYRTPGQRDRDRILYSSAFRRLAGVTQVVAADEGHVFHNRLTHSLEVAQVARRLVEKLTVEDPEGVRGVLDPDVVEAAALAHDLGHPPFGHVAELELNDLVTNHGKVLSGFEGNAQSFRIVTKLALQSCEEVGLNLTRASLDAILKYPWLRGTGGDHQLKWGAYQSERRELDWARELDEAGSHRKSAEAAIMDWADDITYAVHDATDFYRAGLIPLDRLASIRDSSERKRFCREVFDRHRTTGLKLKHKESDLEKAVEEVMMYFPLEERYQGTGSQRASLRTYGSGLIDRYIGAVHLSPTKGSAGNRPLWIDPERDKEVFMWKQLTWHYVILNPALATQQYGQQKIIRDLFTIFLEAANGKNLAILPFAYREQLDSGMDSEMKVRTVADLISSFTERQAINLHRRLTGISLGSILDRVELS
jgi:dGTPase